MVDGEFDDPLAPVTNSAVPRMGTVFTFLYFDLAVKAVRHLVARVGGNQFAFVEFELAEQDFCYIDSHSVCVLFVRNKGRYPSTLQPTVCENRASRHHFRHEASHKLRNTYFRRS